MNTTQQNPIIAWALSKLQGQEPGPLEASINEIKIAHSDLAGARRVQSAEYLALGEHLKKLDAIELELLRAIDSAIKAETEQLNQSLG